MASCLGMYIEDNLIKYAKVTKEHDDLKIDSFGVKFFDKENEAIKQIIEETFSYKIPISINSAKEQYLFFEMFSLLNKNDLKKAINTEFETYCFEKGFNNNSLLNTYALTSMLNQPDRLKTIFMYVNKVEVNKCLQEFSEYKLSKIVPLPMVMPNLVDIQKKDNFLILNLEKTSSLTTVIDGRIYNVKKLENGIGSDLEAINIKENSYAKAYEIFKNITIYTSESFELQENDNLMYLESIIMNLMKVVDEVKSEVDSYKEIFEKIYITGTGSVINNIDLFFQEKFLNIKCEILKPYFVNQNIKINVKDYIEVNSAIAVAMQGLGYGIKKLNFKPKQFVEKLLEFMKIDFDSGFSLVSKKGKEKKDTSKNKSKPSRTTGKFKFGDNIKNKFLPNSFDFKLVFTRIAVQLVLFIIIYGCITVNIDKQMTVKKSEVDKVEQATSQEISMINNNINEIKTKTSEYVNNKKELEELESQYSDKVNKRNAVTTLLNEIMYIIPKEVTLTSLEIKNNQINDNKTVYKVVMVAQAPKYEYLGYLKAKIKEDNILKKDTVVSSSGEQQGDLIKVTIEGELP